MPQQAAGKKGRQIPQPQIPSAHPEAGEQPKVTQHRQKQNIRQPGRSAAHRGEEIVADTQNTAQQQATHQLDHGVDGVGHPSNRRQKPPEG